MNVVLNKEFFKHSKEFQTRPVNAAKYQSGMENGFMVYCSGKDAKEKCHEAMKFFNTEKEALEYIVSNPKQYINTESGLEEIVTTYGEPQPVICNRATDRSSEYCYAILDEPLVSDESEEYEWCDLLEDSWIIQE